MAKILALDDLQYATILIGKILSKKGHNVHSFTEEDEALAYAKINKVDLAILEIKLKKMSGVEVLERLKEVQPTIKTIILTGYPTVESARKAISLGANEYCVKPVDRKELENKVQQVLKSRKKKSAMSI